MTVKGRTGGHLMETAGVVSKSVPLTIRACFLLDQQVTKAAYLSIQLGILLR